jgi:hypothetical protein
VTLISQEYNEMPDVDKVQFDTVPPRSLRAVLPRVAELNSRDVAEMLLNGLLKLSPLLRLSAKRALEILASQDSPSDDAGGQQTLSSLIALRLGSKSPIGHE